MDDQELREQFQAINQQFKSLATLVEGVKDSLEREITVVRERVDRMDARLDKIAAGAHYVTRLAEWSEVQDRFQLDLLHRVQVLEDRMNKFQGNGGRPQPNPGA